MRNHCLITLLIILASAISPLAAQRKVTPVESDENKPEQPRLHYYDKHGNKLKEPVLFLAELDTVQTVSSGPVYPLINGVSIGANFFDAVMRLCGQTYQSYDIWADISLHNWFFPVAEFGVGFGKNTPENGNFSYTAHPSFYAKLGLNYNFFYKSDDRYQGFLGLRAGFSSFSYSVDNITISSDYWNQSNTFSLPRQHASAFYGEIVAGLKVRIVKNFSLGWTGRYHFKFKVNNGESSIPWFIPGYGASSPVTATFSLIYTIPIGKRKILNDSSEN